MNSKERLTRCYFNQEIDRPAVYSRSGFPHNDPSYDRLREYLAMHSELKNGWYARTVQASYSVDYREEPYSDTHKRVISILHTPKGDLTSTRLEGIGTNSGMHETFYIKDEDDAEKYLSLSVPKIEGDITPYFHLRDEIGERGIAEIFLFSNPAGITAELMGSETFAIMSVTHRDIVHEICQREMDILMEVVKYHIDRNAGPFFAMQGQEYIVPPLHGPKDFYDFNVKYDKPVIDLIHNAGGRIHIHSHGSIKKVLHVFIDMGADVLHPFEAPPLGDITPGEAKKMVRGKLCLEGNIQIADMYERTPEEIRKETLELIEAAFDDQRGLIVCPTASPYIFGKGEQCFEQYKAMIDAVLSWTKY